MKKLQADDLFDPEHIRNRRPLQRIPYTFHYEYRTKGDDGQIKHLLSDWEIGALFWNCYYKHAPTWRTPFRKKLLTEFGSKDLVLLLGTVHRFPGTWIAAGIVYPPKGALAAGVQGLLL